MFWADYVSNRAGFLPIVTNTGLLKQRDLANTKENSEIGNAEFNLLQYTILN